MADAPGIAEEADALVEEFDMRFPVTRDSTRKLLRIAERQALEFPILIAFRDNKTAVILAGTLARTNAGDIASMLDVGTTAAAAIGHNAQSGEDPHRRFVHIKAPALWRSDTVVGVSLNRADLLTADDSMLYVFDHATMLLHAFTGSGVPLWTYGDDWNVERPWNGPLDITASEAGVLVLDGRSELVEIDKEGVLTRVRTTARESARLVITRSGKQIAFGEDAAYLAHVRRPDGSIKHVVELDARLAAVHPLARELYAVNIPKSDAVVFAYRYSGQFGVFSTDSPVVRLYDGIEPIEFPRTVSWRVRGGHRLTRVSPRAREGALDIAADSEAIYLLFRGETELAGRVIDVYKRSSGEYDFSLVLPEAASRIRVAGGKLWAIVTSSAAAGRYLASWRLPDEGSESSGDRP